MKMQHPRTTLVRTTLAASCLLALGAGGVSTAQAQSSPTTTSVSSLTALERAVPAMLSRAGPFPMPASAG